MVAVTVYAACAATAVGVPEMTPVVASRLNPAGSAGLTLYDATIPVTVGASGVIATPTVAEMVVWTYENPLGAERFTVTAALPLLVVSSVEVAITVAVPAPAGVKTPELLTVPIDAGLTDHVTAVLKVPVPDTVAAHAEVAPVASVAGEQATATLVIVGDVLPPPLDALPPQPVINTTPDNTPRASKAKAIGQRIRISIRLGKSTASLALKKIVLPA